MGGVMLIFATAAALGWGGFVIAMQVFCGVADLATNWQMYKPYWDRFALEVNTGKDLDYGAEALATLLGGILLAMGRRTSSAGRWRREGRARRAETRQQIRQRGERGNNAARWKATAEQGLKELKDHAAHSDDPHKTKIDPGKNVTPEDRMNLAKQHPELLESIRQMASKFGFPPEIAAGYAMLAFKNGWTIVCAHVRKRPIDSASRHGHGSASPEKACSSSTRSIASWASSFRTAPSTSRTIFIRETATRRSSFPRFITRKIPTRPRDRSRWTEQAMREEFKSANKFEFRKMKMGKREPRGSVPQRQNGHRRRRHRRECTSMKGQDLVLPLPQWMLHNDAASSCRTS